MDVNEKKKAFFGFLAPLVQLENSIIERERNFVLAVQEKLRRGQSVPSKQMKQLHALAKRYQVDLDSDNIDRKSTRLNSSHVRISYAVFCLKKKNEYSLTYIVR